MAKLIEKIYGDALFELAEESKKVDLFFDESKGVLEVFTQNDELVKLINHPKVNKDEKVTIIENIFKDKVSDDMTGFLVLIVKKDRQKFIEKIMKYFIGRVKEFKKIGVAEVTSAVILSEDQRKSVEKKLLDTTAYDSFEISYSTDESLIGGMFIRIGDRVVDSSIKTKINNIAKELYKLEV